MRGSRGGVARWARGGGATVGTVCACDACSETCMERVPVSLARCSACAAVVWCWATQNPYKAENGPEGGKTALEAAEVAGGCGGCGWGGGLWALRTRWAHRGCSACGGCVRNQFTGFSPQLAHRWHTLFLPYYRGARDGAARWETNRRATAGTLVGV